MSETDHARRIVRFEGARNVRDLGGLPTRCGGTIRFGALFRGDGLSRLSDRDLEQFGALGLSTIIDLRFAAERERAPDRLPHSAPPRVFVHELLPRSSLEVFERVNRHGADAATAFELMRRNYARIPFEHAREFRDVIHHLIEPGNTPCLIHCTSGKDRTGIAIALVLLALGVAADDVVADYEMSNVEHQPVDVFGPRARPDAVAVVMSAHPDFMRATIAAIEAQAGSFGRYLAEALEFGSAEVETLRALMLG